MNSCVFGKSRPIYGIILFRKKPMTSFFLHLFALFENLYLVFSMFLAKAYEQSKLSVLYLYFFKLQPLKIYFSNLTKVEQQTINVVVIAKVAPPIEMS